MASWGLGLVSSPTSASKLRFMPRTILTSDGQDLQLLCLAQSEVAKLLLSSIYLCIYLGNLS